MLRGGKRVGAGRKPGVALPSVADKECRQAACGTQSAGETEARSSGYNVGFPGSGRHALICAIIFVGVLMRLFDFLTRRSRGIPTPQAPDRLVVSVAMVNELIEIYRSRGFARDPRAEMIGRHLWQLGGEGSLKVAKDQVFRELGTKALSELNEIWRSVKSEERDPAAALEIMRLERAGSVLHKLLGKDAGGLKSVLDDTGKLKQNALDDAVEGYERDRSKVEAALAAMTRKLPKR